MIALVWSLILGATAPAVPVAGAAPKAAEYTVQVSPAWEVELGEELDGQIRGLEVAAETHALLVPLTTAVELRAAADGSVIWRRSDLPGAGLQTAPPVTSPGGPAVGWAGSVTGGTAVFQLLSLTTGQTLLRGPLEAPPVGPPLPVPGPSGLRWYVPLENGLVSVLDETGRPTGPLIQLGGDVKSDLVHLDQWVMAVEGQENTMTGVGHGGKRRFPKGVVPGSMAVDGSRFSLATDRAVRVWKCRTRPGRGPLCHEDWRQDLGGKITAPPLLVRDLVLTPCWDTFLYAFHVENGHLIWRARAGHRLSSAPLLWGPVVAVVPESTATILFFQTDNGAVSGQYQGSQDRMFLDGPVRSGKMLVVPFLQGAEDFPRLAAFSIQIQRQE